MSATAYSACSFASISRSAASCIACLASRRPKASILDLLSDRATKLGENSSRSSEHSLDLVFGDDERRQVAHDGRAGAEREDAFFLERAEGGRRVLLELDADEQPEPADLADAIAAYRAQALHVLRAALPSIQS